MWFEKVKKNCEKKMDKLGKNYTVKPVLTTTCIQRPPVLNDPFQVLPTYFSINFNCIKRPLILTEICWQKLYLATFHHFFFLQMTGRKLFRVRKSSAIYVWYENRKIIYAYENKFVSETVFTRQATVHFLFIFVQNLALSDFQIKIKALKELKGSDFA